MLANGIWALLKSQKSMTKMVFVIAGRSYHTDKFGFN